MDFKEMSKKIIHLIGDQENIVDISHCSTRLRIETKDESKIQLSELEKLTGILKVQIQNGQLQIIIGPNVKDLYQEIIQLTGEFNNIQPKKEDSIIGGLLKSLASIVLPAIAAISSAALLKAILAIFVQVGWLTETSDPYIILNMIGDAPFYFLPMILAVTTARKIKVNEFLALTLAGVLMYPTLSALTTEGVASLNFFGIPVLCVNYSTTVLPIIFGVILLKYVYNFLDKYIPQVFQLIITGGVSLIFTSLVTLIVLAPAGHYLSNYIGDFLVWFFAIAGPIAGIVLGASYATLVMTGLAYGTFPIVMNNIMTVGYDFIIFPIMICSNINQGVACFATGLKLKNAQTKSVAFGATFSAFMGITEPAMYAINLRYKKPFYATMIGTGISGLLCSLLAVKLFTPAGVGILGLAGFINADFASNIWMMLIALGAGMVITFIATLLLLKKDDLNEVQEMSEKAASTQIGSIGEGKIIAIEDVPDSTFSDKLVGEGVAVDIQNGIVISPVDGVVKAIYPTKHAICIQSNDGVEILIHVGVDTVKLEGKYFECPLQINQKINKGEQIISFDYTELKKAGVYTPTILVVTNIENYTSIEMTSQSNCQKETTLMSLA